MMSRNRLVALALVALMTTTTLASLSPVATAQDVVPTKPTVPMAPLPNLEQRFYLRFAQNPDTNALDCAAPGALALQPVTDSRVNPACIYPEAVAEPAPRVYSTGADLTPRRVVNVTGNSSFRYFHHGGVPDGMSLRVEVRTGETTLASGTIPGDSDATAFVANLTLVGTAANTGRGQILGTVPLRVVLTPVLPGAGGTVPVSPTAWSVRQTGSYLELRAQDALRAATWITDERDNVRDVFSPIANDSFRPQDEDRRIVGHFALQSAFGPDDAELRADPRFHILSDGQPREVRAGGETFLRGARNLSASAPAQGLIVWTFEQGTLNYRGLPGGAYAVRVEARLHNGAPITQGIEDAFAITTQAVTLAPYVDPRAPELAESQSHTVLSGSTTTYVLGVTNDGSINDTFTINLSAANAPGGWGAQVGGPDVLARRIFVPAGETRVFTVTVTAPFTPTGEVVHIVNVTSTLDPSARSQQLTLVTTIGTQATREVGVVFLPRDLAIEPGIDNVYSVYVWNRGTRVANVSLEIANVLAAGWRGELLLGNTGVGRMVLSGIQPGDIAEAQLRVIGPVSGSPDRQPIRLNATSLDGAGIARELEVVFTLRQLAGVRVQVLADVNGIGHVVEAGSDDGVNGIWFRVWVTNTGRASDTFSLSADSFAKSSCDTSLLPGGSTTGRSAIFTPGTGSDAMGGDFAFYTRTSGGAANGLSQLTLNPGQTGEVYLFLPTDRTQALCPDRIRGVDFYSMVIQAASQATNAVGRAPAEAIARQTDTNAGQSRQNGVYLENVVRKEGAIVDIGNASSRLVFGGVVPGETAYYRVRLTNLASWGEFTQGSTARRPVVNVSVIGTEGEPEWNISVRQVLDNATNADYNTTNPFKRSVEVDNKNPSRELRREAWFDTELEVRVEAPANGSAATNARAEFSLLAQIVGTDAKSTIEMTSVVVDRARINVSAFPNRALAHPGAPAAFLLTLSNVGGSATNVTLQAAMAPGLTNAALWSVTPNAQSFTLQPFTNRTVALLVTPPPGAQQGQSAEVSLNVTYFDRPTIEPGSTARATLASPLAVDIVAPGTLQLTTTRTDTTIAPGGTANFTMTVRNAGSLEVPFRVLATPIPNWTVSASPESGRLAPGETRTVVLVAIAPTDVKNDTRFASVVRVEEQGAANNFGSAAFHVNILGGTALPRLTVPTMVKRVDRDGVQQFEVGIQNIGSAAGRIPLEVRSSDAAWRVGLVDAAGNNVTSLQLGPNELQTVNVTVRAPRSVPERAIVPVEIIAYSQDLTQSAKATLTAEIHDYGVQMEIQPSTKDGLPGVTTEFVVRLRNTGNDNDTLNLSVNLVDLPEWSVDLSSQEVRLEPDQEAEVRATIRSPTTPLPAARSYTFPFWVGTRGGQAVDIPRNMTVGAVVSIPNYRAHDVDRDGQLEIAVDLDRRAGNGFEAFREISPSGLSTQVIADPLFEGRTTFFLDVPTERHDGVADIWFNPETVHAFQITHFPDINGDATPDYLIDADRDGKLDKAFDSATERFWDVTEISVFGDTRIQYLVDITGDGRPDRFFDPESGRVTRTQNADNVGANTVGIDVDDDDRVDYYYNTRTRATSGAEVQNVGSFARTYWYFFVVFAALVLLTVLLVVRRRRSG